MMMQESQSKNKKSGSSMEMSNINLDDNNNNNNKGDLQRQNSSNFLHNFNPYNPKNKCCCFNAREIESAHDNHHYDEHELKEMQKIQSIDYLPQNSYVYRQWLRNEGKPSAAFTWGMYGLVGFSVGILGFFVKNIVYILTEFRMELIKENIHHHDLFLAWVYALLLSVCFALISSAVIVFGAPEAAGSGLPAVIAYLNGSRIRYIFNFRIALAKFVSVIFSVSSGLPVGPEGPMVHLGAALGKGISQGRLTKKFDQYQTAQQRRNFLSAGASAGIAAAFGAPVGGTLFAMEEVASYWDTQLTWQIFFCAMAATFTANTFSTAFKGFQASPLPFGVYTKTETILFEVEHQLPVNLFMLIPVLFIGLLSGILASIFTVINLRVTRWRKKMIFPNKYLRLVEVCLIAIVMATLSIYLPAAFPCVTTCAKGNIGDKKTDIISPDDSCLLRRRNPRYVSPRLPVFMCEEIDHVTTKHHTSSIASNASHNETKIIPENTENVPEKHKDTQQYNEMAALIMLPGDEAIEHLFSRATPNEFHPGVLLVFLLIYFPLAAYTAGSSVSSGLVVPILLIGSSLGRLIGQLTFTFVANNTQVPNDWVDPGAFALIGAASFFGGVSRLTVSLAVIMMEITNDGSYLMPIMFGSIIAKWTADYFTHSLYHGLIEIKAYPFLDKSSSQNLNSKLELYRVEEIMVSPVSYLNDVSSVEDIVNILMSTPHGGYPIVEVDPRAGNGRGGPPFFRGTILRLHLIAILEHIQEHGFTALGKSKKSKRGTLIDIRKKNHGQYVDYRFLEKLHIKNPLHKNGSILTNFLLAMKNSNCAENLIDLRPYCNYSAPSVSQDSSVNRALILFQALGLRHLIVTDKMNCVIGILTRKDLLGFRLDEKLHHSSDDRIFEPNPLVEATKYRASTNYSPKSSSEIRKRTNRGSASWDENVVTSSPKTRSHLLPSASLPSNGLDD